MIIQSEGKISKKINVFGPFDRFNYGDLLFPIVLEYCFNNYEPYLERKYFGTFSFNLLKSGGLKGDGFKALRKEVNKEKRAVVLVAGGESIAATWHELYSFKSKIYGWLCSFKLFNKILRHTELVRRLMNARSNFPFQVCEEDYSSDLSVVFNSVGCIFQDEFIFLHSREEKVYMAVRDGLSYNKIVNDKSISPFLVPDSAVMISKILDKKHLSKCSIREEIINLNNTQYCVFQISKHHAEQYYLEISRQLNLIKDTTGMRIVLCPFATLHRHENHVAMKAIMEVGRKKFTYIANPSVDEISYLLLHSSCFIGSSLHGNVVAMSYGIPHIPIGINHIKLESYLNTWGTRQYRKVHPPNDFFKASEGILDDLNAILDLRENTEKQQESYVQSFKRILEMINL